MSVSNQIEYPTRHFWLNEMQKMVKPVLTRLSEMPLVNSGSLNRDSCTHLEALGRVLCGIAPWLEAYLEDSDERDIRNEYLHLSYLAIIEYFAIDKKPEKQNIIDFGYLCQAFIRCPSLWRSLPDSTQFLIRDFNAKLDTLLPIANNWVVMDAMPSAFFLSLGESINPAKIDLALRLTDTWYKGDGIYGDGINLQNDYYNSLVMHPGLDDIAEVIFYSFYKEEWHKFPRYIRARAYRYSEIQERMISPEGTYPVQGRSITYRFGVFHALSHALWKGYYPGNRAAANHALATVVSRFIPTMYDSNGWLKIGFIGDENKAIAEPYISTGSLYAAALIFPILGTSTRDPVWISPTNTEWTSQLAFGGSSFHKYVALGDPDPKPLV